MVDDFFHAVGEVALFVEEVDEDVDAGGFFVAEGVFADLVMQVAVEVFFVGDGRPHVFGFVAADLVAGGDGGGEAGGFECAVVGRFAPFEQGVVLQPVVHFAFQFEAGHLQHAQRLLQALVELLRLFEFEVEGLSAHNVFFITVLIVEVFAEIDGAHLFVVHQLFGAAGGEHRAVADDEGAVADAQGFAHVMVGDEHADAAFF